MTEISHPMDYFKEILDWVVKNKPNKNELSKKKIELCNKFKIKKIPTDIEILLNADSQITKLAKPYLTTKPVRTGSGVAVVATMTEPRNCPHGSCTFCPGGPKSVFGDMPKSYTGKEPSTMRGLRNDFDPYRIVFNRLEQYIVLGQNPDKVEQIIMGGTFPSYSKEYQVEFVRLSFKAMNDFSNEFYQKGIFNIDKFKMFFELPGAVDDENREKNIKKKVLSLKEKNVKSLLEEQKINETASIRCIGLTVETKPDWAFKEHGLEFLKMGVTRVELGVQTIYDEILKSTNRGHTVKDTIKSIKGLKNLGFKLNFHIMPGLPDENHKRISKEKDLISLKTILTHPDYQPDMVKIYPCLVMPGTALEKYFISGKFKPLSTEEAAEIIVEAKKFVKEWTRIMRVNRDIPTYVTKAGVSKTNLRQYVESLAKQKKIICRCIRCREIKKNLPKKELIYKKLSYDSSDGKEIFIASESEDRLAGFLRLRFPSGYLHSAITKKTALVRELHVYGPAKMIGKSNDKNTQHKGIGKKLMSIAEEIAKDNKMDKIVVISGVGVREYYRKLGYKKEGPYMVKSWPK